MFVGRSENSISVIVKHMQHVGIIGTFCPPGGTKKFYLLPPLPLPFNNCPGSQNERNGCSLNMVMSYTIGNPIKRRFLKDQ